MSILLRRTATLWMLAGGVAAAQPAPEGPPPEAPDAPVPGSPGPEPPAAEQPAPIDPSVPTIRIQGRVIDALGRPVRGATVTVEETAAATRTRHNGWFELDAPIGASLIVESTVHGAALATVTGDVLDDIVVLSEDQLAETIEIESEAPPASPGAAQLDRKELQRVPGTGGDLVRTLKVMPGVVNTPMPLGFSGIVIRGSSPQDSKILIDEFEVPLLFHNIGFRSIVPTEAIASLDYIPGGFDVAYGRASSGIVALTTRPGETKRTTQAEVSVIDGGLLAQGPAGPRTRYMFALRRSTIDFVLPSVIPESVDLSLTTVPRYWDEQLRIDHELSSKWRLTLSNLGTDDTFEVFRTKDEDAASKRFFNRNRFARVSALARYKDGPWQANLALSGIWQQFVFEAGLYQKIETSLPAVTPRVEVTRSEPTALGLENVVWRVGGELQSGRAAIDLALPRSPREGEANPVYDPKDTSLTFDGNVWIADFAAWTALAADFAPRVRVTTGMRAEAFTRNSEVALQPRGEVQVKLADHWKMRLSAGAFRRPPEYQSEILYEHLKSERSTQTILGLEYEPRGGARVQASTYYTDRTQLITTGMGGVLENSGRGTTTGAELLATYRVGPWFGWLSYSYSHSTRVDRPGADERLFDYDQPHSLNAAGSWKRGRWQLGGRFQLYSGLPYTPIMGSVFDSDRNLYIPINGDVNSERKPTHHQLDLRVDYSWRWGPAALTAFADVQNVYMNENIVNYRYSFDYSERGEISELPIIPSIGLRGML